MTTNPNPAPVPPPGSEAARKAGCMCSAVDNNNGEGFGAVYDSAGREMSRAYYIARNCPLHADPLDNLTMRPRADAETGGPHVD